MRWTLFDGYLYKYCSIKYQTFHQVSEKTSQQTYSHQKTTWKAFQMPQTAIKHQLTCPMKLTSGSFLIGRRGNLVIPRNRLVRSDFLLKIKIVECKTIALFLLKATGLFLLSLLSFFMATLGGQMRSEGGSSFGSQNRTESKFLKSWLTGRLKGITVNTGSLMLPGLILLFLAQPKSQERACFLNI